MQKIPILMVTTRGVKDDIIEALTAKVSNYIVNILKLEEEAAVATAPEMKDILASLT